MGELPEPTKDGYVFSGWYTTSTFEDGTGVNEETIVTSSITDLYANYTKGMYGLNLDLDGGSTTGELSYQVEYQDTIELDRPTKTGYTFAGWEVTEGDATVDGDNVTMGTKTSTIKILPTRYK